MDNSMRVGLSIILLGGGVVLSSSLTHADSANASEGVDEHTVILDEAVVSGRTDNRDMTQPNGSSKSKQRFLSEPRSDHSTDVAAPREDGIPIAPRSHNARSEHRDPIMPEFVEYLGFSKGTYYMDVGDLSPTGYGDYRLADYFDQAAVFNVKAGYRFSNDLSLQMDVFNLLDVNDFSIVHFLESQWYGGRLGEHKFGDVYIHPVEPRTIQLRLKLQF